MKHITIDSSWGKHATAVSLDLPEEKEMEFLRRGLANLWLHTVNSEIDKEVFGEAKGQRGKVDYSEDIAAKILACAGKWGLSVVVTPKVSKAKEKSRVVATKLLAQLRDMACLDMWLEKHGAIQPDFTTEEELVDFVHENF